MVDNQLRLYWLNGECWWNRASVGIRMIIQKSEVENGVWLISLVYFLIETLNSKTYSFQGKAYEYAVLSFINTAIFVHNISIRRLVIERLLVIIMKLQCIHQNKWRVHLKRDSCSTCRPGMSFNTRWTRRTTTTTTTSCSLIVSSLWYCFRWRDCFFLLTSMKHPHSIVLTRVIGKCIEFVMFLILGLEHFPPGLEGGGATSVIRLGGDDDCLHDWWGGDE